MSIREAISLALGSLKTAKMRSMLTLLGIIIGIASVITIMTLGHALKTQTFGSLAALGASDLSVSVTQRSEAAEEEQNYFNEAVADPDSLITEAQVEALREHFGPQISGVGIGNPSYQRGEVHRLSSIGASLAAKDQKVSLAPVNADFLWMNSVDIEAGRPILEQDLSEERHVAVISPEVSDALFEGDANAALGSEIEFTAEGESQVFNVVGVAKKAKQGLLVGSMETASVYIPYALLPAEVDSDSGVLTPDAYSSISVRVAGTGDSNQLKQDIQSYFDQLYESNDDYRVKVSDFGSELESVNSVLNSISMVVAAIGGISLLVGGIGVMNVMLITVTERTREIGVRKALGARRRDIKWQFVIEAMIIGLVGGMIGVVIGSVFGMIGAQLLGTFVFPPLGVVLVSLLFSLATGLFFGYYPAAKAARLNPIDALRYE
ncbi:ABC transporter permease [Corynebacterium sp. H128]|uniref:ABC transporter permease n=1 Tax=Corynebacterium sp. H128 TaxID=3133427 RepID=UPI00309BC760